MPAARPRSNAMWRPGCEALATVCCVLAVAGGPACAREARQVSPPAPPLGVCNASLCGQCTSMCGRHGQCHERQCVCDHGYSSEGSDGAACGNGDVAALVAFNQPSGDPRQMLATTWRCPRCTNPCASSAVMPVVRAGGAPAEFASTRGDDAWNNPRVGFVGIMCDRPGGRVSYFNVLAATVAVNPPTCDLVASIDALAGLPFLKTLSLDGCASVHGNIETLSALRQLRYLNLRDTSVHGAVGSLWPLSHLGEFYRAPDGSGGTGLFLERSRVHGRVEMLRALPGLGPTWGSLPEHFSSCEAWAAPTDPLHPTVSSAEAHGLFACVDEHPAPLGCEFCDHCRPTESMCIHTDTSLLLRPRYMQLLATAPLRAPQVMMRALAAPEELVCTTSATTVLLACAHSRG